MFQLQVDVPGAPRTIPMHELSATEILVGERVVLSLVPSYLPCTLDVTSAPDGAAPVVDGAALIVDRSGAYAVTVRMGTAEVSVRLVAFPAEAMSSPRLAVIGPGGGTSDTERSMLGRRLILRSLAQHGPPAEGLTAAQPLPSIPLGIYGG